MNAGLLVHQPQISKVKCTSTVASVARCEQPSLLDRLVFNHGRDWDLIRPDCRRRPVGPFVLRSYSAVQHHIKVLFRRAVRKHRKSKLREIRHCGSAPLLVSSLIFIIRLKKWAAIVKIH